MLRDPWTIRHPYICRFLLIPVSLLILLGLLSVPAFDGQIRAVYDGTILKQFTVYSTMLFIRILPFSEDIIHAVFRVLCIVAVFALPQLFYSYHYHRKPREGQTIVIFIGIFLISVYFHAQMCQDRFTGVVQVHHNGNPISQKDLNENIGRPLYWRKDLQYRQYGYYTDGSLVTYISRNEKGHFEVAAPFPWIDAGY